MQGRRQAAPPKQLRAWQKAYPQPPTSDATLLEELTATAQQFTSRRHLRQAQEEQARLQQQRGAVAGERGGKPVQTIKGAHWPCCTGLV